MSVFVVDTNKTPLAPCHEDRARRLLKSGKAAIYRRFPCTIILKRTVENPQVPELRIKLDPGSKTTGIAVVDAPIREGYLCSRIIPPRTYDQRELR